ncbi:MAG: hypothetical protein AUI47_10160 [Acidobacteria bacterium 13_1_40CM_2_68_5]|nr:MAG: hypothetical protein AUI47_10160 [Acidobacteria bacterium 13_1_40CM_2_68_5]OLE66596.1 MAG: hypothetical protein AUG09_06650 [Acidobacteria bacterium 13_1_20CM_2_68_7]
MNKAALAWIGLALCTVAAAPPPAGESPYGGVPPTGGRIYHIEYLRAFPGKTGDYDQFVKTVFRPMLDAMVARGIWLKYSFLTVPYHGVSPCADYTHVFVAQLRGFAALDDEQRVWAELQKRFHPDEAERRRLFEDELPKIREMVREEFLQDFDWK